MFLVKSVIQLTYVGSYGDKWFQYFGFQGKTPNYFPAAVAK